MYRSTRVVVLMLSLSLSAAAPALAQGKSEGKERGRDKQTKAEAKPGKQHQKADKAEKRQDDKAGRADKAGRSDTRGQAARAQGADKQAKRKYHQAVRKQDMRPSVVRFANSNRASDRIAAGAVARANARGLRDDDVVIRRSGERIQLVNRSGVTLLDLDERKARDLGNWRVSPVNDRVKEGAPAFCRSGEGHPVWGRQWCLDKGFGLGEYRNLRWGRTDVSDIRLGRNTDTGDLTRAVLVDVLGDVVFNRLGLHAVTLGYADPLVGSWIGEPAGPRVLRISSGGYPVAEIVDNNRDDRGDVLLVALRPW